ncbi:MAG: entericidin A/B family lipoprotein [Pseudomonadota bacterium]
MRVAIGTLLISLLAACNTIEGVGKDISKGGDVIADTASDVKEDISD